LLSLAIDITNVYEETIVLHSYVSTIRFVTVHVTSGALTCSGRSTRLGFGLDKGHITSHNGLRVQPDLRSCVTRTRIPHTAQFPIQDTRTSVCRPTVVHSLTSHGDQASSKKSIVFNNATRCHSFSHVLENKNIKKPSFGGSDRLTGIKNEHLKRLAHQVPSVLLASHADSTNKAYSRLFQIWKSWARSYGDISILPADSYFVSLFLIQQSKTNKSASTLRMFLPSLKWAHRMAGIKHDLDQQYLTDIASGLKGFFQNPYKEKTCSPHKTC
jgi:hypothetical protein